MKASSHLAALARRAIDGDAVALAELLEELEPLVVRTARLVVGSGSWAAEDAAQEALIDIARGVADVRSPDVILAWALRVATTRAIKVSRRERLLSFRRSPAIDLELLAESPSEPIDERRRALKSAFDRLTPRLRATAVLRLHLALSETEAATILGCSRQTVRSNLHRARAELKRALDESGFAPATVLHKERSFPDERQTDEFIR
jgi:RNA polymerase sigma-70 factor (ECF subfamily)